MVVYKANCVEVVCVECKTKLFSFQKEGLTVSEAVSFSEPYDKAILCRACSEVPVQLPEYLN